MESNKILQSDVLDIIFEQKNKQYGAYELRKNYHRRARKSVMIVAIIAFVISSVPLIAGLFDKDEVIVKKPKDYRSTILELPKDVPPVTKKKEPVQEVKEVKTAKFVKPEITKTEDVKEADVPKSQKELSQTNIGPENNDGPETGPVTLNPEPGNRKTGEPVVEVTPIKEKTFDTGLLEQYPEFPGGEDAMAAFLKSNLKYPKKAQEEGESGKVVLEFVVDRNGKISEIDFLKKAGFGFDDEAKRVMNMMPDWKPGKINGEPVKARYQIPILFELED